MTLGGQHGDSHEGCAPVDTLVAMRVERAFTQPEKWFWFGPATGLTHFQLKSCLPLCPKYNGPLLPSELLKRSTLSFFLNLCCRYLNTDLPDLQELQQDADTFSARGASIKDSLVTGKGATLNDDGIALL